MIKSLKITGYRGFKDLEMGHLGRVNLLVGKNNSGKTSALEALSLLSSGYDPSALMRIVNRRGEIVFPEVQQGQQLRQDIDISHLFHEHELRSGTSFEIATKAENSIPHKKVIYSIVDVNRDQIHPHYIATHGMAGNALVGPYLGLKLETLEPSQPFSIIPLSKRLLRPEDLQVLNNLRQGQKSPVNYQLVSTESLLPMELTAAWNSVVLTPEEDLVTKALRYLEPRIERIAAVSPSLAPFFYQQGVSRSGFKVKLADVPDPLPVGTLGDGIWRMLALAIAITRARDGVLLVDEIDTGLHYSIMADMWKLISGSAKEFNIQVFATTHSYDCIHSLASICTPDSRDEVTIQRLEVGKASTVPFSADEIVSAAKNYIEVR